MPTRSTFKREVGILPKEISDYDLTGDAATLIDYRNMREKDTTVASAMRAIELPIKSAKYDIVPPDDPSVEEQNATDVLKDAIFNYLPWEEIITGTVTALTYGFSVQEIVIENRDGLRLPSKIAFRPQESWEEPTNARNKNGEVKRLLQVYENKRMVFPREKLIICSIEARSKGEWQGRSILKACFEPWVKKRRLDNIYSASAERWGFGIPVIKLPPIDATDPAEIQRLTQIAADQLANIQNGTNSQIVLPADYEISILEGPKNQIDTLEAIKHHEKNIYTSILIKQPFNASEETGAGAKFFIDETLKSIESWANQIVKAFNEDLISLLMKMNWPTIRSPKMIVSNILNNRITEIIGYLVQSKVIQSNEDVTRYIYDNYNIPGDPKKAVPSLLEKMNKVNKEIETENENTNEEERT